MPPPIVVVEDHNEALEEVHRFIRAKKVPFDGLAVLHIDAHPDLSVPEIPAEMVFEPAQLYDYLEESEGGISEWILPLVFAGHVRLIWWLRPEWTTEIPDGLHECTVGAVEPTAEELAEGLEEGEGRASVGTLTEKPEKPAPRQLRIASDLQYFVDEPWCVASKDRMDPQRDLRLLVSTVEPPPATPLEASQDSSQDSSGGEWRSAFDSEAGEVRACRGWMLDICLDYFGTHNPFHYLLSTLYGAPGLARALTAAVQAATAATCAAMADLEARLRSRRVLEAGLTRLLDQALSLSGEGGQGGEGAIEDELVALFPSKVIGSQLIGSVAAEAGRASREQLEAAKRMIPCATLPDHRSTTSEALENVQELRQFLSRPALSSLGPPCLVTVARSSGDPYTPPERTRWLQAMIINLVADLYGAPVAPVLTSPVLRPPRPVPARFSCSEALQAGRADTRRRKRMARHLWSSGDPLGDPLSMSGSGLDWSDDEEGLRPRQQRARQPESTGAVSRLAISRLASEADCLAALAAPTRSSEGGARQGVWVATAEQNTDPMRQPWQGCLVADATGRVIFDSPSHLLADAAEVWACGGGIGSSVARWVYHQGMLFGSTKKWWTEGSRLTAHEGIDFASYLDLPGGFARDLEVGAEVKPMLPGTVVAVFKDLVAETVVLAHDVAPPRLDATRENGSSMEGPASMRAAGFELAHASHPGILVKTWVAGRRLLTIYAHVESSVAPGAVLASPWQVLGTVAAGKAAPAHLHLSVAWTSGPVPSSWPDLLSSEAIEIVEPPTPAGYCSRGL